MGIVIEFDKARKKFLDRKGKISTCNMDIYDIIDIEASINPVFWKKDVHEWTEKDLRYLHRILINKYKKSEAEYEKIKKLIIDVKTGEFSRRFKRGGST